MWWLIALELKEAERALFSSSAHLLTGWLGSFGAYFLQFCIYFRYWIPSLKCSQWRCFSPACRLLLPLADHCLCYAKALDFRQSHLSIFGTIFCAIGVLLWNFLPVLLFWSPLPVFCFWLCQSLRYHITVCDSGWVGFCSGWERPFFSFHADT